MTTSQARTSYDEVPYDSFPYAQTHPDRLAVIATLLGLKPAPVSRCRVLELGCAAGGNIIPLAVSLPESVFVGGDLSSVQIKQGIQLVTKLGLRNIELRHLSILDVAPELGKFDYILCHGVYSWVPTAVQDKILEVCKQNLSPNGVAYVSYNTYPGWHMRGMIRDMLSYHSQQFRDPAMRVKQARNLLDFLAKSVAKENSLYSLLLKGELESFQRSSDAYLYHEHLEDVNEPIYFHQFAERAAAKGLRYLAETDLRVMVPGNYPREIENVLQMLAQDLVHMEQYMDFLRNRMFRQSLVCHDNLTPNYQLRPEQLRAFKIASPVRVTEKPAAPAPSGDKDGGTNQEPVHFEGADGIKLASRDPLVQTAMKHLGSIWPQTLPFDQIVDIARHEVATDKQPNSATLPADRQTLGQAFLTFYASASTSLIELHLHPPMLTATATERPMASLLARTQAATSGRVTSQRHETVTLGEFERHLLRHLDGTHNRAGLLDAMRKLVATGELTVEKDGQPITDEKKLAEVLAEAIDRQLAHFARIALLTG